MRKLCTVFVLLIALLTMNVSCGQAASGAGYSEGWLMIDDGGMGFQVYLPDYRMDHNGQENTLSIYLNSPHILITAKLIKDPNLNTYSEIVQECRNNYGSNKVETLSFNGYQMVCCKLDGDSLTNGYQIAFPNRAGRASGAYSLVFIGDRNDPGLYSSMKEIVSTIGLMCDACDGSGVCSCGGSYLCDACNGSGECRYCDGIGFQYK